MNVRFEDLGEDFGVLVIVPDRDDSIWIPPHTPKHLTSIRIPLYAPDAQEIRNALYPLASADKEMD
jgi:hypothetical protein